MFWEEVFFGNLMTALFFFALYFMRKVYYWYMDYLHLYQMRENVRSVLQNVGSLLVGAQAAFALDDVKNIKSVLGSIYEHMIKLNNNNHKQHFEDFFVRDATVDSLRFPKYEPNVRNFAECFHKNNKNYKDKNEKIAKHKKRPVNFVEKPILTKKATQIFGNFDAPINGDNKNNKKNENDLTKKNDKKESKEDIFKLE